MSRSSAHKYQYETSPRKLAPDYTTPKNPKMPKKSTTVSKGTKKKHETKRRVQTKAKQRAVMLNYIIIGFIIVFAISYRNSQIDENFAKVQSLKYDLSELEKQNTQLQISIENSLNLNDVEQQAKELLGMQKLNSRQTIYVSLPKTDYIETVSESVIIEENLSLFQRIIDGIGNIFR